MFMTNEDLLLAFSDLLDAKLKSGIPKQIRIALEPVEKRIAEHTAWNEKFEKLMAELSENVEAHEKRMAELTAKMDRIEERMDA